MTAALFPAHWGKPQGVFYHRTASGPYGLSLPGETLDAYKARVKSAYGNLRGVTFHDAREESPCN
jgi:hypothetical protein